MENITYNPTYVAFLDILGFRDIALNNPYEQLVRKYRNLFEANVQHSLSGGAFLKAVGESGDPVVVPDGSRVTINCLTISDSVLMWTKNDSMKSFIDIVAACRNLLVSGIFSGFPMRGTVVLGPLTTLSYTYPSPTDNTMQTFLGRSIVEAVDNEKKQQWSGCVVSTECVERYENLCARFAGKIPDLANISYLVEKRILCRYAVPYKGGHIEEYVIDWPSGNKTPPSERVVRRAFSMHNKSVDDPGVQAKIENTLKFVTECLKC